MSKIFNRLKKYIRPYLYSRYFIIGLLMVILTLILLIKLFTLQIIKGEDYLNNFKLQIHKTQEIKSTRGAIYDRNGYPLAYNELAYAVTIEDNGAYDYLSNDEKNDALNGNIQEVLYILDQNGDSEVTYFYIGVNDNGEFVFTKDEGTSRNRFIADVFGAKSFDDLDYDKKNATPDMIMEYLCNDRYHIDIDAIGKREAVRIVNIRYAMSQISYSKYLVTTIANDISNETVTMIKENSDKLVGIDITADYLRRYNDAEYFAPIIGYTGIMSAEEYDELAAVSDEYALNDIVGKAGIEQSMDLTLRGQKGRKTFYTDSVGTVLETTDITEPVAGGDLYLSIDHDLQVVCYKIIEQELAGILITKIIDQMEYDPHEENSTYDIKIPISDVYIALLDNAVVDINDFPDAAEDSRQHKAYAAYETRIDSAVSGVINEILEPSGTYMELDKEKRAYCSYVTGTLLKKNAQIIDSERVDTADEIYKAWNDDGSISLRDYLDHCISSDWIDISKLSGYLETDSKYAQADEIINAIIAYLNDNLYDNTDYSKLVYKFLIQDGTISGNDVCIMLYEQGVLDNTDGMLEALTSGSINPYDFIIGKIRTLDITPAQLALEPCTGSVVITDPNNGEVLALVSYPGYDNNRLANTMDSEYYNKLVRDKSTPLYNYATQEKTAPGSTFKLVTSAAGLEEGIIDDESTYLCDGIFGEISPPPKCWSYPNAHGDENVRTAIRDSCNVFFFNIGYALGTDKDGNFSNNLGIEKIAEYAKKFGLGDKSGVEIQEVSPQVSDFDAVRSAIGQGTHNYTTSQLARYISAVANSGTVYNLTLLDKLIDQNGKIIETYDADIYDQLDFKESTWKNLQEGMKLMAENNSTLYTVVHDSGISMGGKTGTAEQSSIHADNVAFVAFAPYNDPQIAFAVRIANGYTSAYATEVGRDILKYYFNILDEDQIVDGMANSVGSAGSSD